MARHGGRGRRCSFESLENRRLLAGDIDRSREAGNGKSDTARP